MANILFVVVENLRQYCRSPPLEGSVLHLVCESRASNKSINRTRNQLAFYNQCGLRAGYLPRWAAAVKLKLAAKRAMKTWSTYETLFNCVGFSHSCSCQHSNTI